MKYAIYVLWAVFALSSCKKTTTPPQESTTLYTCSMHPDVQSDHPGKCPKCGMDLVPKEHPTHEQKETTLDVLLKPTNEFVISSLPVVSMRSAKKKIKIQALGEIQYDTRQIGNIAARISGRIEKLYIRYRYQKISKGQKIMDIYSPEILDAQQNLLFLLKNDASNAMMIRSAKKKLLLLGMNEQQLNDVIARGTPDFSIAVYSNYAGHVHEAGMAGFMGEAPTDAMSMNAPPTASSIELKLKEGMYVKKGQTIFSVYNPDKAWALLNIFPENNALVKQGQSVTIISETAPNKAFTAELSFIEPFFRSTSKTLTTRVYFDNSRMQLPIGSQVKAEITSTERIGNWLPKEAVISLGLTKVVFKKVAQGFVAKQIEIGDATEKEVEIRTGLSASDLVANNAQYLMDSESFIKINRHSL